MENIKQYINDGANWQAQCVLSYLRYLEDRICSSTWNDKLRKYNAQILVGRFENCREQGYVFTLLHNSKQLIHFCVYEHRNSDDLCVKEFDGVFINTPTIQQIPFKDKWDYTKSFSYGSIVDCGEYIADRMKSILKNLEENGK